MLYFDCTFWTILITLIAFLINPTVVNDEHFYRQIPLFTRYYWFFTSYFIVFFAMPALNYIILNMPLESLKRIIITFFVLFSLLTSIPYIGFHNYLGRNAFLLNEGYSPIWLAYMYLIGAFIKQYSLSQLLPANWACFSKSIKRRPYGILLILIIILLVLSYITPYVHSIIARKLKLINLISPSWSGCYLSPFNVLISILLFELFRIIEIQKFNNIILFCGKYSFDVFLIHCHYYSLKYISDKYHFINSNPYLAFPVTLASGICLFGICVFGGYIRELLFQFFRIENKVKKICKES